MSVSGAIRRRRALRHAAGRVRIDRSAAIGPQVLIEVGRDAVLEIGPRVVLERASRILVRSGRVVLEEGARLSPRASIVALAEVVLAPGALIGEMAVVIDFAASGEDVEAPLRAQPPAAEPVRIGAGAVVGPKAVVGAGTSVPDGARVLAGATLAGDEAPLSESP